MPCGRFSRTVEAPALAGDERRARRRPCRPCAPARTTTARSATERARLAVSTRSTANVKRAPPRRHLRDVVDHADERDVLAFPFRRERIGEADLRAPRGVARIRALRRPRSSSAAASHASRACVARPRQRNRQQRAAGRHARTTARHDGSTGCHCSSTAPAANAARAKGSAGMAAGPARVHACGQWTQRATKRCRARGRAGQPSI